MRLLASLRREHLPLNLFILVFWLFTLQIGRLSGYVNSTLELFKSYIYFVNCAPGFAKFLQCIFWIIFHIAKPVFNLACLHFIFIPQSNMSFCNFAWGEWWVCLEEFPIVLWLYLSIYLSIFYLTGSSLITEFIFWRIYPA